MLRAIADALWRAGCKDLSTAVHAFAHNRAMRALRGTVKVYERLCFDCLMTGDTPKVVASTSLGKDGCTRCGKYGWLTAVEKR